jgi:hypothetical protein
LADGRHANVVLVGARDNPKGAVLVLPGETVGQVQTEPLQSAWVRLRPDHALGVLCMQERAFGKNGLKAPTETASP